MVLPHNQQNDRFIHYLKCSVGFVISVFSAPLIAGGFQISDHSVTSLGRAHSGYGVVGDDASAIHFNPAGMTLLKKRQAQTGLVYHDVSGKFEDTGSTGVNTGENLDGSENGTVPSSYFSMPLNTQWTFGLGLTVPFGTASDYDDDFIGRYNGLKTELAAINLNPSIAYKVSDTFSVGAGLNIQKLNVRLTRALYTGGTDGLVDAEGDSVDYGINAGVMLTLAENTRIGFSYRSRIEHDLEGEATFKGVGAADGTFDIESYFESPAVSYLGVYQPVSDHIAITLGARWTDWSSLNETRTEFPNGNGGSGEDDVDVLEWRDSWTYMIGIDGKVNQYWGWRAGYGQDNTPVPDDTRSVRTIDSDREWYTIGATYVLSHNAVFDFAYRYMNFERAPVNKTIIAADGVTPVGTLEGEFKNSSIHTFALQFRYIF